MRVLFVGTYSRKEPHASGKGEGIHSFQLCDAASGEVELKPLGTPTAVLNPSYLIVSTCGRYLFSVSEAAERQLSKVHSFAITENTGQLELLQSYDPRGEGTCYLSQHGNYLLTSNYNSGSAACFQVQSDGRLTEKGACQLDSASGVVVERQEAPHAHCATPNPHTAQAYVADLGADRLYCFDLLPDGGGWRPSSTPHLTLPPGCGPRHVVVHPRLAVLFVACELSNAVLVGRVNTSDKSVEWLQSVGTLPDGDEHCFAGDAKLGQTVSHVQLAPDCRSLYVSNRGVRNCITSFAVDASKGTLELTGFVSSGGLIPRAFLVEPTGHLMLVANQESDNIVLFAIDETTGRLTPTGQQFPCPTPVCLAIAHV